MIDLLKTHRNQMTYILSEFNETSEEDAEHTEESIRVFVNRMNQMFQLDQDTVEQICRFLETNIDISQDSGFSVKMDFKSWIKDADIDFHYWDRYKRYLIKQGRPLHSTRKITEITEEIIDFCGNPNDKTLKRRGMVIGDVQAGKTENYTGVICRAADAGYKFIIVLTGLTNMLRSQTQERLDLGFIGKRAVLGLPYKKIGAAADEPYPLHPNYFTTITEDFSLRFAKNNHLSFSKGSFSDPIIFVTKKNVKTLDNLAQWFKSNSPTEQVEHPLLLIDDEADNASINTASDPERTTKINDGIRSILSQFKKSCYLGYTATPYANIFIDPLKDKNMERDDLFPSNFIKLLSPPSNYVGPNYFFGEDPQNDSSPLIEIDDHEEILPLNHKNGFSVTEIPNSLKKALRLFVIFRAIRVIQGNGKKHCSMLVNVSRFNSVQDEVSDQIFDYLEKIRNAVDVCSGLSENEAMKNEHLQNLRQDYAEEYEKLQGNVYGFNSWNEIQSSLPEGIGSIEVETVNMREKGKLSYRINEENGLHVVAVGGFALSRGLTLEGLSISYILRRGSAFDSLMQMGRWFGYRDGYAGLCRLFLTGESKEHYEFINEATKELKEDLEVMDFADLTPMEFGLKVRHHSSSLRITALNKMRNAESTLFGYDPRGRAREGAFLYNSKEKNQRNRIKAKEFIESLGETSNNPSIVRPEFFWEDIDADKVLNFINSIELPNQNTAFAKVHGRPGSKKSFLQFYIEERFEELQRWDVALPTVKRPRANQRFTENEIIPGKTFFCRFRGSGFLTNNYEIYKVNKSRRVSGVKGLDAKWGLTLEQFKTLEDSEVIYNLNRKKPLLVIHVFLPELAEFMPEFELLDSKCVTVSVSLPGKTQMQIKEERYFINTIAQLLGNTDIEYDEDEESEHYQSL